MKFLIENNTSRAEGIGAVLTACGHDVALWDQATKPTFDAFDESEPDVFIGDYRNNTIAKCLKERPDTLLVSYRTVGFAANTFKFGHGRRRPELECEISCLAEITEEQFKLWVQPLLHYNIKLFGKTKWDVPEYLGSVTTETLNDIYISSNIVLCFGPEEDYNVCLTGGLPITDFSKQDYLQNIDNFIKMRKTRRDEYIDTRRRMIYNSRTYWHITSDLFEKELDMKKEARRVLEIYDSTRTDLL